MTDQTDRVEDLVELDPGMVLGDDARIPMTSERMNPRELRLLEVNARFMPKETYDRLVANMRRDGACSQSVLVYDPPGAALLPLVLSGNHRVQAAIEAGLDEVPAEVIRVPISEQRQIALQLSHNAISGEDDPATLRALYDKLGVDMRDYSGLDDKELDLLPDVDIEGLSEANLDFASVQLVFLPAELDRARELLGQAREIAQADERWVAAFKQYEPTLDTLQTAHAAWNVGNVATALGLIFAVFERHLADARDAWFDAGEGLPRRGGLVPIETLLGTRSMPAEPAAVIARAMDEAVRRGDVQPGDQWRLLELMAADYLAGA